jgi:lipopolysaccharide export system permease protein
MGIIARYLTREIGKNFGIILIAVMGIYLAVDIIEKIDNFIEAGLSLERAFLYFIYKLPLIVFQITPVATLMAVLITFGLMAKNNELVALRSGGISLMSLVAPIARCGITATLLVLVMAEGVAPLTLPRANQIWLQEVRGQNIITTQQQDIWFRGDQSIIHLKHFQPDTKTIQGITIHWFDRQFRLVRRIDAEAGSFEEGRWRLHNGIEQYQRDSTERMHVTLFEERPVQLTFTPDDLARAAPRTEEMSFMQLRRLIARVASEGYDVTHYRVDLHGKIAFPFVCIILTLVGAGLAARGKIRDGLPISITYGIGIAFLYWIVFSFCISLGYAGMLPPLIAAWGVNFIAMCLAGYLLINAD